jgi:PKD repeat protein
LTAQAASCTTYISGNNCNTTDAALTINQVLNNSSDDTVYLQGPYTFNINSTIIVGNNTTLTGDSSAVIKLKNNANWSASVPLISSTSSAHDIRICGFKVDGNREGNTNVISGQNYYNIFQFTNVNNLDIHDMYLTNNYNDGLNLKSCNNVKYHNNTLYLLGHDGLYSCNSNNVEACNNVITCRTNSGLGVYNSNHVSFHDNTITSQGSGCAGIEVQKYSDAIQMNDINIYNNIIHDTAYAGIWIFGSSSYLPSDTYVHIYNNNVYKTGTKQISVNIGGILSDGFNGLIENNMIDSTYGSGIAQANIYNDTPKGSGFALTISNNSITNVKTGYGICNNLNITHSFILNDNYLRNNLPEDYYGINNISEPVQIILPVANFTCNMTSGYAPITVQFTDISQNAASISWDFGDGTNSTDQNPVHTYSVAGNYTVSLKASNANGTDSKIVKINVSAKSTLPIFPGCIKPPTDLNQDGFYEDINGNVRLDYADVVTYFNDMAWIGQNSLTTCFDYNHNSRIDFNDVVMLYNMIGQF